RRGTWPGAREFFRFLDFVFLGLSTLISRGRLEGERDAPLSAVHAQHQNLDFLAWLDYISGASHSLWRQFRDMNQALNSRLQFDKCTEFHEPSDFSLNNAVERIVRIGGIPRTGGQLLCTQAYLALVSIQLKNNHLDRLSGLDQIGRLLP